MRSPLTARPPHFLCKACAGLLVSSSTRMCNLPMRSCIISGGCESTPLQTQPWGQPIQRLIRHPLSSKRTNLERVLLMSQARNVIWTEGLFLTPHLFQQADRYRENLLHFRLKPITPFFWGVSELEIDRAGLPNGFFTLERCSGVMPDGLTVQIPDEDRGPEARSVKTFFAPAAETLDVYLAIQAQHPSSMNVHLENGTSSRAVRYQMEMARVNDETVEGNE